MRALVVGAAPGGHTHRVAVLAGSCDAVIAVDAGAHACIEAGVEPDVIVGDMDSIEPAILDACEEAGSEILRYPSDKDATDLDIALDLVRERGFDCVVLTGVVGGRADHTLSALGAVVRAADLWSLIDEADLRGWALGGRGRHELELAGLGATVSIFALGGRAEARSSGLRWSLDGLRFEAHSSLGQSNLIVSEPARIEWRSGSLIVLSPQVGDVAPAREI